MGRPHLLHLGAVLLLVVLAGCSAAGSMTMDPVTDAEIAERASQSLRAPEPGSGHDPEARMLRSALENGTGTIEAVSPPIEEDSPPFAHDGAYYDLTWEVVDRRTATSVSLLIDYNATEPEGEEIAYADLPAADRRALDALLPPRYDRDTDGYDFGAATIYDDSEFEQSVLVSERRTVVVFESEAYRVRVDGTREVSIRTYRYTSTKIADSPDEYTGDLKDEYLFALNGLSRAEREVVETAIDGGYYAEDSDDEAFRSVVERFERHEAIEGGDTHGEWLVRYDGEVYWVGLEFGSFVEE